MAAKYTDWNPWHGCTKCSPGCKYCYVYRSDERRGNAERARECRKTANFDLPLKRARDKSFKIAPGTIVFTCFTSDFLLPEADEWRNECWSMMRARCDCWFYFFTKRIERFMDCVPGDWGDGYDNVIVGCTIENQDRADFRLPIFAALPIKHKSIIVAPLLESIDIDKYLDASIEEVSASGESGPDARPCNYDWIVDIRSACVAKGIPFSFHQTGANFIKDGKKYFIPRKLQKSQAKKAGIDYMIRYDGVPRNADYKESPPRPGEHQISFDELNGECKNMALHQNVWG